MHLQVVYDWRDIRLAQRLLGRSESITFGTGPRAALIAPEGQLDHLGRDPWPRRMKLLQPAGRGFRLRLVPAMTGRLHLQGQVVDVGSLFTAPAPKRLLGKAAIHREVTLVDGDSAEIVVDAVNQLRLSLKFVEPLLFKTAFWTINSILSALIVIIYFGSRVPPFTPRWDISAERLAKITAKAPELDLARKAAEQRARD